MSRDQRVHDNWALLYAQHLALTYNRPLAVVFCLQSSFLGATLRQFDFMLHGLQETSNELQKYSIPFFMIEETPTKAFNWLDKKVKLGAVVTDFSPLKIGREWRETVAKQLAVPLIEVDAHNIIPSWLASDKQEFAAYSFRPKVHKKLDEYLVHFPKVKTQEQSLYSILSNELQLPDTEVDTILIQSTQRWRVSSIQNLLDKMPSLDRKVQPVSWCQPGESAARNVLDTFIVDILPRYNDERNDPTKKAQSELSPYLHFGQISSQTIALRIQERIQSKSNPNADAFLEELIVRKELSDNYCLYNQQYDNPNGFPDWAKKSLVEHAADPREYLYTLDQLEQAQTHDELWNASQLEMVHHGKMHGYMRMYWAKKILEWTTSPAQAVEFAIYLNDKYELDGRDPNGYVGILWSLGGLHDRAWFERPIFGKIRYMNYNGAKRKFDVEKYVKQLNILKK